MNRSRYAVVVVVALLFASGCVGLGGGPSPGDTGATTTGSGGGGGGSGGGGGAFEPADSFEDVRTDRQMDDYIDRSPFPVYRPGEYFHYEGRSSMAADSEALQPTTMTIESGDGGEWLEADVEVTLVRGEDTTTFTEDDPAMMFTPELSFTANGRTWIWLFRYNLVTNVDPRISELSVGDTWTYESDGETALVFSVTEAETYAGVDCVRVVTEQVDGDERFVWTESCVAPDVGLPLYFVQYDDAGAIQYELELVEYRR